MQNSVCIHMNQQITSQQQWEAPKSFRRLTVFPVGGTKTLEGCLNCPTVPVGVTQGCWP